MLSLIEKSRRIDDASYITQRYHLALAIWREARSETTRGMRLVGEVIKNRVEDSRWGDNYVSVITQPWQFSSYNSNDPQSKLFPKGHYDSTGNHRSWINCWAIAGDVLDDPEDISHGCNHYFATYIPTPSWADPDKLVTKEGVHAFYKL